MLFVSLRTYWSLVLVTVLSHCTVVLRPDCSRKYSSILRNDPRDENLIGLLTKLKAHTKKGLLF